MKETNDIVFENVTKFYNMKHKKNFILKNCSVSIPGNKNIGILGRNGAGKSTLLRLLGGIEKPNKGEIILPHNKSFSWTMALSGGFQASLSGLDNVQFVARLYGFYGEDLKKIIKEVYDFSELGDFFYEPVKNYSSGMKAKLAFGLSTAIRFDYYLIDETLSVGDRHFKNKCKCKITELQENSNFLLVSHDLQVLKEMSDLVLMVDDNTIKIYEDIDEAIAIYNKL